MIQKDVFHCFLKLSFITNIRIFGRYRIHPQGVSSTHATSNLGIRLNGKIGLYLEDLANPKDYASLIPNPL
jgi:hypothetical protein